MKNVLILLTSIFLFSGAEAQQDEALIRETLQQYITGSTNGQPDLLKKAFHPDLNLYYVKKGEFAVWSGVDYIASTKEGEPTGEIGKILAIDYTNDAAMAKVEIADPRSTVPYIDYFMLLKIKDKWTIIHKMFTPNSSKK